MASIMQSTDEALTNLAAALRPFQDLARDTLVTMSVSLVQTFLMVAMKPDQTNSELARAAGVPNGTMSRQLADLSDISRSGAPGLCLIEQRIYTFDRRHTTNRLSSKGAALVRQIAGALQGRRLSGCRCS
jgi:DNA-binding MarR family transcriptional regulator